MLRTEESVMQDALVVIKPDAVKRPGVPSSIMAELESEGFNIVALRSMTMSNEDASSLYDVHSQKDFFSGLVEFMSSGPCVVIHVKRENCINVVRNLVSRLRSRFATSTRENVIHASDSTVAATREVALFFGHCESTPIEVLTL